MPILTGINKGALNLMPLMSYKDSKGFTLVELLAVVAISGIVSIAIIGFFISQQRSHSAQEQVTFMQQNVRAALGVMTKELRMTGYDAGTAFSVADQIINPGLSQITFRMNLPIPPPPAAANNVLTDPGEQITYSLSGETLMRQNQADPAEAIADSIEALAFAYAYDSDADGVLEPGGNTYAIAGSDGAGPLNGTVNWYSVNNVTGVTSNTMVPARAGEIRAIKIWILAKADNGDLTYTNNNTYVVGTQTITPNDDRRRLLLETVVHCRNMGL